MVYGIHFGPSDDALESQDRIGTFHAHVLSHGLYLPLLHVPHGLNLFLEDFCLWIDVQIWNLDQLRLCPDPKHVEEALARVLCLGAVCLSRGLFQMILTVVEIPEADLLPYFWKGAMVIVDNFWTDLETNDSTRQLPLRMTLADVGKQLPFQLSTSPPPPVL